MAYESVSSQKIVLREGVTLYSSHKCTSIAPADCYLFDNH